MVYPREELGISLAYRYEVQNEIRILRRRVSLRGDWVIGYVHTGGYHLLREVDALPDS